MSVESPVEVIDLHSHITHPEYPPVPPPGADPGLAGSLRTNLERIADLDAQRELLDERGIDIRVLGASPSLFHPDGLAPPDWIAAVNDHLAARVAEHPDRFLGLASIDAFDGERAAREVTRAVRELSLAGIIVDSTDGARLIGGPESRPALEAAAELSVPVFVHPTSSHRSLAVDALGSRGIILDRGTNNAAGLLSVLHHQILRELPTLRLLFAALAVGGLAAAVQVGIEDELRGEGTGGIYVDTMGFKAPVIRFAIDVLGVDRIVIGTDWPIQQVDASADVLGRTFAAIEADEETVARISAVNARSFLGLPTSVTSTG
jgi:predicted TIM-barrel fold metal-dependent hydrolase